MRFVVSALSSLFLATGLAAQQAPMSTWMTHQAPISGNQGVPLTDQQVVTYSEQALQGSGPAANKLGMHFLAAHNNRKMSEYWYHISAENGDPGGELTYGSMIFDDSSDNKVRSLFWLKKSASQGNEYARRQLQQMMHCPNLVDSEPCS